MDIIETPSAGFDSEQVKLKAQELRFDFPLKFHEDVPCLILKLEIVIRRSISLHLILPFETASLLVTYGLFSVSFYYFFPFLYW